jgi:hypothetical protein
MENEQAVAQQEKDSSKANAAKKKKEPKSKSKPVNTAGSSITQTLRAASGGITIYVEPEQSFYIICIPSIVKFAARFEGILRSMSRRNPGHPASLNYFAVFMWCLLAKLARVGVKSQQVVLSASEMPDASWCKLPPLVAGVIDSFGCFEDTVNHVHVAPRVTRELLTYLRTVVISAITPANAADVRVAANHFGYLPACYGAFVAGQIYVSDVLRVVSPGVVCAVSNAADFPRAVARSLLSVAVANNAFGVNVQNRLLAGVNAQDWFTGADAAVAEVPDILDGQATANFIAEKNNIAARFTNAANPANGINVPALSSLFPSVGTVDVYSIKADVCFIESLYACVTPSFSTDGTTSPTVVVSNAGYGFTCTSSAHSVTVQDCIVGALLDQARVFWVTPRDVAFALHGLNQTMRVQTTPFSISVDSLISQALHDGRRAGAY